ncbi:MAG: TIGR03960 family B12-binding radical SAM protein [Candidatus Omnitrophica bacterium]|nr:TIGR03960 family B12-binding radical SAM protein [Candidatus Omnitrophota bacterium]
MNLDEILLTVQKPGRYIGGEWNSVRKEWTDDLVKILLAFPDVYEVGMSYLGLKILYGILNKCKDCLCERVFSPWVDMEEVLRKNRIDLFSLESRRPISEFDIIGFSLAYELSYTNVLNILDLGGIPKRASERGDDDPLIIAGGPACSNPEPMAEFIDLFVVGEGEEVILEIVEAYKNSKLKTKESRRGLLRELANIKGCYVPSLYEVEYNPDNTIKKFTPVEKEIGSKVEKRIVSDLENAFYPTEQIVPYIEIVHDRIALEIMRGCKHMCRFCQAGTIYKPSRERSRKRVLKLAEEAYRATGFDEISLLSLSSADHSHILEIIKDLNAIFKDRAVSISVPSLRVEDVLKNLPSLISQVRKTGLTFAPETASETIRKVINKKIDIEKLFEAVSESFKRGWQRVKLYFMMGLPAEKEEDLLAMAELINKISSLKRNIDGNYAQVRASINAFVPKPHTPFQWCATENLATLTRKSAILKDHIKSAPARRMIKLDFHSFQMSRLEAVFSRGDRRLSDSLHEAWRSGARYDGWQDFFNYDLWMKAFEVTGIDPHFYAERTRGFDEILPWDFIDIGINVKFPFAST